MPDSSPSRNRYRTKRQTAAVQRGAVVLKGLCVVLLLLSLTLVYAILFGAKGWQGYCHQRRQVAAMTDAIHKLEEQNQQLFARIQNLKTDPIAQERLVRQQLGWVRHNEWVIEFPPPHPPHSR